MVFILRRNRYGFHSRMGAVPLSIGFGIAGVSVPIESGRRQRIRNLLVPGIHLAADGTPLALFPEDADALRNDLGAVHFGFADPVNLAGDHIDLTRLPDDILLQGGDGIVLLGGEAGKRDSACSDGDRVPGRIEVIPGAAHAAVSAVNAVGRRFADHIHARMDVPDICAGI